MITKTVIPTAGFGTRMLPAAKAVPKELLPILDRPTIQYVVEEAAAGGISDALLITSRDKRAIEDHFDRHSELEARLKSGGKEELLASVNTLMSQVRIHATRQAEQKGLGHAVLQAKEHVGSEAFLCQLGDTVFSAPHATPLPAKQLLTAFEKLATTIVGLEKVPAEKVSRYGIVGGVEISPGVLKLDTLVEKPSIESAPSAYAICARYILTPDIFTCLEETPAGQGGEIQLTDALKRMLLRGPIHGVVLEATRHDIGNPVDWLRTNLIYAKKQPALWQAILPLLRDLMD